MSETDQRKDAEQETGAQVKQELENMPAAESKKPALKNQAALTSAKVLGSRKGSTVSFQDKCELYEIDLEKGERKKEVIKRKPSPCRSLRYFVVALALLSPFVTTYGRTIINFAIIDMIDPEFIEKSSSSNKEVEQTRNGTELPYFDRDHSCPVSDADRERLLNENLEDVKRARSSTGEKFQWDSVTQGLLKSAYAMGHMPLQIPGGRLSEIYGSHLVMSTSALFMGLCCLSAPWLAAIHYRLLFVDLVILGTLGSFMTPALITLYSNWLTPSEKSIGVTLCLIASRLGYALSSLLCGLLIEAQLSWRYVFFSAGWVGVSFSLVFFICARSRPSDHPFISQLELDYLATKNRLVRESLAKTKIKTSAKQVELKMKGEEETGATSVEKVKPKTSAPWFAILTNVPVWAFILTKFCVKLAGDTVQIELPTYIKRVMHFSARDNGMLNAWNYVMFCVGCFVVGALSKFVSKQQAFGLSKTVLRKLFQCTASFGVALILFGIAFSVCDNTSTHILLLLYFLVTTFGTGGEAQMPVDLTERYSGTIHAIGSSLAISGVIEPILVGYLLRGHTADRDSWKAVWLGASGVALFGGLVFLFFADANVQPFDRLQDEEEKPACKSKGNLNEAFEKEADVNEAKNAVPVEASEGKEEASYKESKVI